MGYCCCRVFGFYFSGEAVLVFYYRYPLFLLLIMIILLLVSHLLASMSG